MHKNCNDMMPHNPANGEPEKEAAWKYCFHRLTGLPITPQNTVIADKLYAKAKEIIKLEGYHSDAAKTQTDSFVGKLDSTNAPERNAILKTWYDYKARSSNYTPDEIDRKKGEHPNIKECLTYRGGDIIYKNKTLNQLLEENRKPHEAPVGTFQRLIKSAQRQIQRQQSK